MKPVVSIFLIALTALLISAIPDTLGFQNHQANHPLLGLTRHNIHDLVDEVDSIVARKQYSRLYALEDRFKLAAKIVPDSLRSAFRGACMWYANKLVTTTGDYPTALTYYLLAHHQVTDSICLDAYSWYIENEISTIYTRLGDYEKSEVYAWMVVRSLQCHHQWKELARYYSNIGINQQSLGNLDDARKTFLEGLRLADSMQYKAGIFSNCLGLGELFIQEMKWEEAEPYLSRARKVLPDISLSDRRLEKESGLYAAEAKIRQVQGNFLGSAALYIAAIQSLRQYYENTTRREFAKLYAALASCYLKTDSLDQALTAMRQGFHSLVPALGEGFVKADTNFLYPENTFIELFRYQYEWNLRKYEGTSDVTYLNHGLESIEQALYVNDLIRESVIAEPSKLRSIRDNKALVNLGVGLLYKLNTVSPDQVWLAKARSLFTRSKSILFNDAIRNHLVREAMTAQDQRQLDSIANIKSMLVENQFGENPDFNAIQAGLIRANEALIQLQKRYQVNNLTTVKLPHYIDYVEADDHIYSYAQLNGRTQFVRLGPRQEFDSLKRRFDHYILLKELSQDDSIGLQLYQFLVSPLSQKLPARVTIIPDGDIGLIPFDMLEVDKGEMVLEHSIVSYQFQFEPYAATGDRKSHPFRIYCLAPTYPKKDPLFAGTERGSVYQLPFARQEADTIKTIFGQSVIVSTQGDKAQCKEQMISSNVFHFSGHAIVNASNAFLALTDDGDIRHQLIDDEIALMQCPMDLAVLSACETGLGKMEYGEGIRSLGRSFLEAGASAAIYSLWTVNDKSTSAIMAGLYKNLHKGKPKDEALRQAKLDFIHTASVAMPHPYYWAGFVATGDMRPVRNRSIAMLIFMGIVVLTGVGIGITNMIRRAAVKSGSTAA